MAFKPQLTRGQLRKPRRAIVYGPRGIGKSTLSKGNLVLDFEDGTNDLDAARIQCRGVDYQGFVSACNYLFELDFDEPIVFFDTLGAIQAIFEADVCHKLGVPSIDAVEYGKGPGQLLPYWHFFNTFLDALKEKKGKNVVLLAHETKIKVKPPDKEQYEQYSPAVLDPGSSLLQSLCDEVFHYKYKTLFVTEKGGFNKTRQVTIETPEQERYFQTQSTAGAVAKNRLSLPFMIGSFDRYKAFLPGVAQ